VAAAFTYQGQLKDLGVPANGLYDLDFQLYDSRTEGTPIGESVLKEEVEVTNGLFKVILDFDSGTFNGEDRWLEISMRRSIAGTPFVVLTPRELLTAAPYALYALSGPGGGGFWMPSANDIYSANTGNVGIGTTNPGRKLQIGNNTIPNSEGMIRLASRSGTQGSNRIWDVGVPETDGDSSRFGYSFVIDDTLLGTDPEFMVKYGSGNVGIGTAYPAVKLHVDGGTDVSPTGGGYVVFGSTAGANLALDNNEIMARNDGAASSLFLNASGGNVLLSNSTGRVGVGTSTPQARLDVVGRIEADVTEQSAGYVWTHGPNGSYNAGLTHLENYPNNGYVSVRNASNTTVAGMYVNSSGAGVIFANVKNFREPNPREPETEIVYASLEGPEAAAYIRGTSRLVAGSAIVQLPEHFQDVAVPEGMTVQVTPCSAASKGLAVVEQAQDHFVVAELLQGTGDYEFHWRVEAVRKGHEDYRVIRSRSEGRAAVAQTD